MKLFRILSFSFVAFFLTLFVTSCDDDTVATDDDLSQEGNYVVLGTAFSDDILSLLNITQSIVADNDTLVKLNCVADSSYQSYVYEDSIHMYAFRSFAYTSSRPVEVCVEATPKAGISSEVVKSVKNFTYYVKGGTIENYPSVSTWASITKQADILNKTFEDVETSYEGGEDVFLSYLSGCCREITISEIFY